MAQLAIAGGTPVWHAGWPTWPIYGDRENELLQQVLTSGKWAGDGPMEAQFQRGFADLHGAKHGLAVNSGTMALQLALEALDIGVGDEVIVPVNTWQATAVAVLDVNAVPVLVDIEPETYAIDPAAVEAAITPRTRAVIPVHLYCNLANLDRIVAIARQHQLAVIEDCAHSHGSTWNGQGVGTLGDIGCFSLQASKTLNAGEGGFVITNDDQLHSRLYSLRNCGRMHKDADPATWTPIQGGNARMTEWQAAVLCAQLERLPDQLVRRERSMQALNAGLEQIAGLAPLARRPEITRQAIYGYVFRYEPEAFNEVPVQAFRKALAAELGTNVSGVYAPLNNSALYQPHTKKRYHLSEAHLRAIDPKQYHTPFATRAHEQESVVLNHPTLLAEPDIVQKVVDGCAKLYTNRDALAAWADAEGTTQ
ncbi:MAG TPA: DegT/DnrJ/EryC1/StrS family aminotransferase [Caldilineaceae bacterium]|nr:DegT/DnrJ/EryC1/StrS family aminotransferase [Caldilineaceae bacterium]